MATIEPYETSGGKRYQVRYRTPERTQTKKRGFKTKREADAWPGLPQPSPSRPSRSGGRRLVLVLAYTGICWGEMIALRVRDLDTARRPIVDPRRRRRGRHRDPRRLTEELRAPLSALHPDARPALREILRRRVTRRALLTRARRRTRTDGSSGGRFAGAVRRAGIPRVTPHDLRHTFASLAIPSGANAEAVQRMLGRKSAAMTLGV